ncbi:MAG: type IX secretion system membrane protein PorP/SprF [Cyclobacteriaceae bacterium]|nr:type IX secretion system membrane protein PorP/SprF [Cyclobacteriaceae bacterium]
MRKLLFSLVFFVMIGSLFAQQDAQFSYYMNNHLYYNPAWAGVENITKITLLHRSQWAWYQSTFDDGGAPTTQVFSLSTPIYKLKSGFGTHIVHDQLGPQNNLEMQGSFAYHLGVKDSKVSVGLRTGFFSQSIQWDYLRAIDPDDPVLSGKSGKESQIRPDMAGGIFFVHEDYYGGVSFNHILKSSFDFGLNDVRNALANHMFITGGYYYDISTMARLHSSALMQTDFKQYNVTLGLILTMMQRGQEQFWGGLTVRQSEDIGALLGYNFLKDKSLKVGYSFGYVFKDRIAKEPTSHEFILMYELPGIGPVNKKIQHTPRFRH